MASNIFGLAPAKQGKYSLQTLAQSSLDGTAPEGLPTNPFSALPLSQSAPATTAVQQVTPAALPGDYKFTGTYDAANRGLQQEESDAGFARRSNLQQIAEAYIKANTRAAETQDKTRRSLFEQLADKGASSSGGALDKDAELSTSYQRYLDDLASARAVDQAGIENNYAGILNSVSRRREGLFGQQQAEEESRRMEEARLQAETERQNAEAEMRRQEMAALIQSQEAARAAAEMAAQQAAAMSVSYSPVSYGGGGYTPSSGGGSPSGAVQDKVVLPFLGATSNVPASAVNSWIKKNVDPTLSGKELQKVATYLVKAGNNGLDRGTLGNFIASLRG